MASGNKKVCISMRELNEVDKLEERIRTIQENCDHDFRLFNKPKLSKSLVRGVFVGGLRGPAQVSCSECMTLVCLKCSEKKVESVIYTCPRCLRSMGEAKCLGAGSREKYFGRSYYYYAAAVARCSNCDFAIAFDEWDQ